MRWTVVGGEQNIGAAIAVHIAESRAARDIEALEGRPRLRGDICKFIAGVVNQEIFFSVRSGLAALFFAEGYRAVGDEEVGPAVVIVVDPARAETGVWVGDGEEAALACDVDKIRHASAGHAVLAKQRRAFAHQVHDEKIFLAPAERVADGHAHAGFGEAVFVVRRAAFDAKLAKGAVALVDPDVILRGVVGDEEVGPTVVVEVGGGDAQPGAERAIDAGAAGYVGEAVAAIVVIEARGYRRVGARRAVIGLAGRRLAGFVGGLRKIHVAEDDEIEAAIAIVIEEGRAGRPGARRLREIDARERAVSVVAIQRRSAVCGEEQVFEAVIVVVTGRGAHAVGDR